MELLKISSALIIIILFIIFGFNEKDMNHIFRIQFEIRKFLTIRKMRSNLFGLVKSARRMHASNLHLKKINALYQIQHEEIQSILNLNIKMEDNIINLFRDGKYELKNLQRTTYADFLRDTK
jgi:hypothetical protein